MSGFHKENFPESVSKIIAGRVYGLFFRGKTDLRHKWVHGTSYQSRWLSTKQTTQFGEPTFFGHGGMSRCCSTKQNILFPYLDLSSAITYLKLLQINHESELFVGGIKQGRVFVRREWKFLAPDQKFRSRSNYWLTQRRPLGLDMVSQQSCRPLSHLSTSLLFPLSRVWFQSCDDRTAMAEPADIKGQNTTVCHCLSGWVGHGK